MLRVKNSGEMLPTHIRSFCWLGRVLIINCRKSNDRPGTTVNHICAWDFNQYIKLPKYYKKLRLVQLKDGPNLFCDRYDCYKLDLDNLIKVPKVSQPKSFKIFVNNFAKISRRPAPNDFQFEKTSDGPIDIDKNLVHCKNRVFSVEKPVYLAVISPDELTMTAIASEFTYVFDLDD